MLDEREMARQARRAVRWNTLALAVLAGVVLLLVVWYGLNRWQHTYTPDKWFSAPNERLDILDDLLGKYDLVGADLLQGGPDVLSPGGHPGLLPGGGHDGRRVAGDLPGGRGGNRVRHRHHLTGKIIRPTCLFHSDVLSSAQDGTPSSEQMTS